MCIGVFACMSSVYHMYKGPKEARGGIGSPGSGATNDCELSHGRWDSNLVLLKEKPVLWENEQTFQSLKNIYYIIIN